MASGTITGGSMTGTATSRYENKIEWSSTKLNSTQSSVTATLYTRCTSVWDGGAYNGTGDAKASITINGSTKSSSSIAISFKNTSAWKAWISNTVTVTHNSDGNKSITISGTYDTNGPSGLKTGSISGTATLDKILPTLSISGPSDWSGNVNSTASFSVTVSGGSSYTYQWYFNGSVVGSNSRTYSRTVSAADNGKTVYCKVTDASGVSITSRSASVTVTSTTITVKSIPTNAYGASGSPITLRATPSGGTNYTYKWYISNSVVGSSSVFSGTLLSSWNGYSIYCQVSDVGGGTAATNTCKINIVPVKGVVQPVKIKSGTKIISAVPIIKTTTGEKYCSWNIAYPENNRANIAIAGKAVVG